MLTAAITLLSISSIGIIGAVILEIKSHDPIWKLMMKIFPLFFGVGAVLLAISMVGS
jgi:uncharacterized protein (DUF983 family)